MSMLFFRFVVLAAHAGGPSIYTVLVCCVRAGIVDAFIVWRRRSRVGGGGGGRLPLNFVYIVRFMHKSSCS